MPGEPRTNWALVFGGALLVAGLSLLWQAAPTTDPWGWIVWGREVAHLDLDTSSSGAPSWKPLPVLITTPLSVFGDASPVLWLLVSRTAGLMAPVFAYRLASRIGGRPAGVLAAGLLILSEGWLQGYLHGYLEPAVVGLLLAAVECHLVGRPRAVLALLFVAGLARPEVWPLFALYGGWRISQDAGQRALVASLLGATAILWFGGDLWGSGNPFHGGEVARAVSEHWGRSGFGTLLLAASGLEIGMVVVSVLGLLVIKPRDSRVSLLAAGSVAWFVLLLALVGAGYPASPRFMAPPVAGLCVLCGVLAVELWRRVATLDVPVRRPAVAVALAFLLIAVVLPRAISSATTFQETRQRAEVQADLRATVRHVGPDRLLRCGAPVLRQDSYWNEGALAWELDLPLASVRVLTAAEAMDLADKRAVVVHAASEAPTRAASLARTRLWSVARFSPGNSVDTGCGGKALQLAMIARP